ncbi:hypothetical protein CHA01nite_29930 [Chryseobacterium hagamense]|uniref:Uncharacterized protein n=2 Tax=Chryseobacterium hagamense TaxID=395935 RepID=A0A511YPY7_9FLAO|nr:hypothetical protein CHA01nite_29930 [Chryseobacterium hagamense]
MPDCEDLSLTLESNSRNTFSFINNDDYNSKLKDSIAKPVKALLKEDKMLYDEFQNLFPDHISTHCIRGKQYGRGETEEISYCSNKQKIILIGKEQNFYIFKLDAFEIDSYILFNTLDKTIYFTENYPMIYDHGKIVFDIGYAYGGSNMINYYKFYDREKTEYFELMMPLRYTIKDFNVIRYPAIHLIAEIEKLSPSEKSSVRNKGCRKLLMIN